MALFKKKNQNDELGKIFIDENTKSSQFEDYNRLKDNLLYINADGKHKIIQIESSIMSEGKTTLLGNLAVTIGQTNKKVLVVDLDFRRPRLHRLFSFSKDCGLSDYFMDKKTKQEIIKKTIYKNVDIITTGAPVYNPSLLLLSDKFKNLLNEFRNEYDFILIDCPPSLGLIVDNALYASDSVLIPVECGFYSYEALTQMINKIDKVQQIKDIEIEGILMTKLDNKNTLGYEIVDKVKFLFPSKIFKTIITRSSHIQEAPMHGMTVLSFSFNSRGSKEYRMLAEEILNNNHIKYNKK